MMRQMVSRSRLGVVRTLTVAAGLALALPAAAQTYTETEDNNTRATANLIPSGGGGIQPGESIGGLTTGTSTTSTGNATADYFNINIGTAPLGIYMQRITLTSPGTQTYTVTLRGFDQDAGVIDTNVDGQVSTSSSSENPRFVQWYGFGKGEQVIMRVTGSSSTSQPYTGTFTRESVTPQTTTTTFSAGPITISTLDQTYSTNTEFWVYDANLDPVAGFNNDDNSVEGGGTGTGNKSIATRELTPGTYYVAISTWNLANDQVSPADERNNDETLWASPGAISTSATLENADVSFTISDGSQTELVAATKVGRLDVVWVQFTVGAQMNIQATPGTAPSPLVPGTPAVFTLDITPAPMAPNTITSATFDLTPIDGPAAFQLFDDGAHSDGAAGDGLFGGEFTVPITAIPRDVSLSYQIEDNGGRMLSGSTSVTVSPVTPPNDVCANATVLMDGGFPFNTTVGINLAGPDQAFGCSTLNESSNGIWYQYTPSVNSLLTVNETGSRNVSFAVLQGSCFGNEVYCDTNDAEASFGLTAGVTYFILVGTPGTASSNPNDTFVLTFNSAALPPPPANDTCAGAFTLTPSTTVQVQAVGGATADPISTSCATIVPEARNGVWYQYTTGASDQLARVSRESGTVTFSVAVYEGGCGFPEYRCINLSTSSTGTVFPMRRNTTYVFLFHRTSGSMAADGEFRFFFNAEDYPNVSNQTCDTAEVVPGLPFNAGVQNVLAFDDPVLGSCPNASLGDAAGAAGVWYVYTPVQPTIVLVEETGSAQDAAVAAFEGSCFGPRVMCSQTDTDTSGSNIFRAQPGVPYYIFVGLQNAGVPNPADLLQVSITGIVVPPVPSNDVCASATVIPSLPYADALSNAMATDEPFKAICARGTISTTTRNGVWYQYTNGPTFAAAVMSQTTAQDTIIAAYTGSCGSLVPVMCTDSPETSNYLYMRPNTTYYILVAHAFDFPSMGNETLAFTMDLAPSIVPPPANDDCATAALVKRVPFNYNDLPLAANHEPDNGCSSGTTTLQSSNGIWFAIDAGSGFTLSVTETSSQDVMYSLYDSCGGNEVGCQTTDTNRTFTLFGGQTYYLLVARQSNSDFTFGATPLNLTITAAAGTSGACCNGTACTVTVIESCGGDFVPGGACDPANPVACCPANFNGVGGVSVQDIFDFLGAYFAGLPSADYNMSGSVSVQDIFDFLSGYFAGCS